MGYDQGQGPTFRSRKRELNTKSISSIEAATRSRLLTVAVDTLLREVARLLSSTQISLVVVCDQAGAMAGVVTKTDIVRQIGHCEGAACTSTAADIMTKDVTFCRATDCLSDVLAMMQARGFGMFRSSTRRAPQQVSSTCGTHFASRANTKSAMTSFSNRSTSDD